MIIYIIYLSHLQKSRYNGNWPVDGQKMMHSKEEKWAFKISYEPIITESGRSYSLRVNHNSGRSCINN